MAASVDLAGQLQASLGTSYTIVRELGGGGMSRVFLAEDNALHRSVVIKLLLPELAASVNADRFKREVQLSARLQHQDPKRAIEMLERYVGGADLLTAARELERGRLAEKIGDRERAVDAFTFVAAVWHNAESPQLREGAKEATDALKRIDSDGGLRAQLGRVAKP